MKTWARNGVLFLLAVAIVSAAGAAAYVLRPDSPTPKPPPQTGRYQFHFAAVEPKLWVMDTSTGDIFTVNADNSLRMQVLGEWFDPRHTSMSKAMEAEWRRRNPLPEWRTPAEQERDKQLEGYLQSVGRKEMTWDERTWASDGGTPPWELPVKHGPDNEYRVDSADNSLWQRSMKPGAQWERVDDGGLPEIRKAMLAEEGKWSVLYARMAAEGREIETYEEKVWATCNFGAPPWERQAPADSK